MSINLKKSCNGIALVQPGFYIDDEMLSLSVYFWALVFVDIRRIQAESVVKYRL